MTFKSLYGLYTVLLLANMIVDFDNAITYGGLAMITLKIWREEEN